MPFQRRVSVLPSRRRFHRHDAVPTSRRPLQRRIPVSTSRHQFQRRDDSLPSRRQPDGERMTANGRRQTDDGERTTSVFNVRWKTSVSTADADRRHLKTEDVRSTTEPTHVVKPLFPIPSGTGSKLPVRRASSVLAVHRR